MIYPWQDGQWQQLQQMKKENRLPHALLFVGMKGLGKSHFTECFIRSELCLQSSCTLSCTCHSCCLIKGKSHPNGLWIEPEKEGSAIKIDQIRHITEFIHQTSLQGEYRFVLINPASNMNVHAANALLKTLEEPSSGSILILIAEQVSHLPATILSRCQRIHFPRPPEKHSLEWLRLKMANHTMDAQLALRLSHGAPLAALEFAQGEFPESRLHLLKSLCSLAKQEEDLLHAASQIEKMEVMPLLDFILGLTMDVLRLHLADDKDLMNFDFIQSLSDLKMRSSPVKLIQYLNDVWQLRGQLQTGIHLNKQLMIESLLNQWVEGFNVSR